MVQDLIQFECTKCKNRNYATTKNLKQNPDKLQRSKFCKFCRQHTAHKEIKK